VALDPGPRSGCFFTAIAKDRNNAIGEWGHATSGEDSFKLVA
jgi:hypothetical protein